MKFCLISKHALLITSSILSLLEPCFAFAKIEQFPSTKKMPEQVKGVSRLSSIYPYLPSGAPIPGTTVARVSEISLSNESSQNFGDLKECTSYSLSNVLGGNVCNYSWITLKPKSGPGWGESVGVTISNGFDTSKHTAIAEELDINNLSHDYGDYKKGGNGIGLLINGLGAMNTAAVSIQTGNSKSGMQGQDGNLAIWFHGFHVGDDATFEDDYSTQSSSKIAFHAYGHHNSSINVADDDTSHAGIILGDGGINQSLGFRHNGSFHPFVYMERNGVVHIGEKGRHIVLDGSITNLSGRQIDLKDDHNHFSNLRISSINGTPIISNRTPNIKSHCIPGAQAVDIKFFYVCLSDKRWHRMKESTD